MSVPAMLIWKVSQIVGIVDRRAPRYCGAVLGDVAVVPVPVLTVVGLAVAVGALPMPQVHERGRIVDVGGVGRAIDLVEGDAAAGVAPAVIQVEAIRPQVPLRMLSVA